jgi:DNA repair protein RecO (recombination protein O)
MESERAEGVVLRTQPVTESSLIVTWFTREFGKMKTLAKGARRPKGPFLGKLDLFYQDELVFLRSRRSDLHLLHECFLVNPHKQLRESVAALAAASYACELVELATEREDPSARVFELLRGMLPALEAGGQAGVLLIWFEQQLLTAAGWAPKWDTNTAAGKLLASLAGTSLAGVARVRLRAEQVEAARAGLHRWWDREVGRVPRSRAAFEKICS